MAAPSAAQQPLSRKITAVARTLLDSTDAAELAEAAAALRAFAAAGRARAVVSAGGIQACMRQLDMSDGSPAVQRAAAQTLTLLARAAGSHAASVVALGGHKALVSCLASSVYPRVQLAALAALRAVFAAGAVPVLVRLHQRNPDALDRQHATLELLRHCAQSSTAACRAVAADERMVCILLSGMSADEYTSPAVVVEAARTAAFVQRGCPDFFEPHFGELAVRRAVALLRRTLRASPAASMCQPSSHGDSNSDSGSDGEGGSRHSGFEAAIRGAQTHATSLLCSLAARSAAARAVLARARGIRVLAQLVRCEPSLVEDVVGVLAQLAADGTAYHRALATAGGVKELVAKSASTSEYTRCAALPACRALTALAKGGPASCQAVLEAGGVPTLGEALSADASTPAQRKAAAEALAWLAACSGTEVADAVSKHTAVLPPDRARLLAAATSAVAAVRARDAPQPAPEPSIPRQRSPRRTCAAPGCGGTRGLYRCGGCGAVWYCGEACRNAHWREHRTDCRRLQAAHLQAGGAGGGTGGAGG